MPDSINIRFTRKHFTKAVLFVFYLYIFGHVLNAKAQQFPIQVSTIVNPPYSVFLADYVESGTDRISTTIMPTDHNLKDYKVKLKLVIESLDGSIRIETSPYYNPSPFFLQGGVMEILSSYDLYDLFNFNNLVFSGYSKTEYQQSRRLPEGIYRMGIELLDYNYAIYEQKEVVVSNFGYSTVYLFLNDPPLLNLPISENKIRVFDPQNIIFQWMPRHKGSINSAFNAQYNLRLYEVWGELTDPNIVANTQMPIFETTLSNNRYVYGLADPLLIPGKYYVWNIQAFEPENRSLFRNKGFSESYWFKYGDECKAPTNLIGDEIRGPGIELKWDGGIGDTDYVLQYKTKEGSIWYDESTLLSNLRIYELTGGATYQSRVKANCGTYESPFSEIVEITTTINPEPIFECGNGAGPEISNTVPQSSLSVGASIRAGGFECLITEVSGSNGIFSGKCDVIIPFYNYAKVPHTFNQVKINQLNQLTEGVLIAEMDSANPLMEKIEEVYTDDNIIADIGTDIPLDELLDADTSITVDGVISDITVDSGTDVITIVTDDGETIVVTLDDDDESAVISDSEGNEYYVVDGQVVSEEEAIASSTGVASTEVSNVDSMRQLLPTIDFIAAETQKYGFDKPLHTELNESYELLDVRGSPQRIAWKAVQTGVAEAVDAVIPVSDEYDASAIGFKSISTRFVANPSGSDDNKTINAVSVLPGTPETLSAYYSMKDSADKVVEEELGKLNLIAYDKIIRNVYIVPVNTDVSSADFNEIKQSINTTYAQAVTEWEVTLHSRFDIEQADWDISPADGIFLAEDADNRMDYTREQKAIYREFKSQTDPDQDAWYVFILPQQTNNSSINGYAIFGKQWVFIYKANAGTDIAHTIAHELGHAAFSLRHTFSQSNDYYLTQNSTQNLMDYAGGSDLNKYQWDLIHDPQNILFAWGQDESEGESQLWSDPVCTQKFIEQFRWAYTNQQPLIYKADGYPWFGHYAKDLILDDKTYENIHVEVRQDLGFVPSKTNYEQIYTRAVFNYGSVLSITTMDLFDDFEDYLFPDSYSTWDSQLNDIISNIDASLSTKDFLSILAIIPKTEFHRLTSSQLNTCLEKITSKGTLSEDYISCINDEEIALAIIDAYGLKDVAGLFNKLGQIKEDDETSFSILYDALDDIGGDDNFSIFIKFLYKYWEQSTYANLESKDIIPYSSKKILGFYFDNYDVTSEDGYLVNYLESDDDGLIEVPYHPYDPVELCEIDQVDNGLNIPSKKVPFFLLKAYDDKNHNSNVLTGGKVTFDAVTTFSGIGNIAKLRHLKHLTKLQKFKVVIGTIEVLSATTNMILTYTDDCNHKEFCQQLSNYLFWVELGSLSMDAYTEYMIKKAAKNASDIGKTVESANHPIIEHLDEVASLGGNLLESVKNTLKASGLTDISILSKLDSWQPSTIVKFDEVLKSSKYSGILDEFINIPSLLDHFEGINTSWFYRLGLTRAHVVSSVDLTLPPNFKNVLGELELFGDSRKISDIIDMNSSQVGSILGLSLENKFTEIITEAFTSRAKIQAADIPSDLKNYYLNIWDQGYTKVSTQVKINTPQGTNPIPDIFFFKFDEINETVELSDVIYHDCKIAKTSSWSDAQTHIKNTYKSGGMYEIVEIPQGSNLIELGLQEGDMITISQINKISTELKNNIINLGRF